MSITFEEANAIANSYLDIKHSWGSSFAYGFSCDECNGSVVARDRKKLVRKGALRTLCWDCMDAGADLYGESKRTPEEIAKAGGLY